MRRKDFEKEVRKAYIGGVIDCIGCLIISLSFAYFALDVIEKYFI